MDTLRHLVTVGTLFLVLLVSPMAGALLGPAPAAMSPAAPTSEESSSERDERALPPLRMPFHHPLLNADPQVWLPALAATGQMDEAVEDAQADAETFYDLHRLGDVNGDGLAEYILQTTVQSEGESVQECYEDVDGEFCYEYENIEFDVELQAVAGGSYAPLWTMKVPEEAYWYPAGDVDRDGVEDLILESFDEQETDEEGMDDLYVPLLLWLSRDSYAGTIRSTIVSGATGAPLVETEAPFSATYSYGDVGYLGGVYFSDYEITMSIVEPVAEGPAGVDTFTLEIRDTTAVAYGLVAYAYASTLAAATDVVRSDLAGKVLWEAHVEDDEVPLLPVDNRDANGDGVADVLFGSYGGATSVGAMAGPPPTTKPLVLLLDGKSGEEAWRHEGDLLFGETLTTSVGPVRGEGRDAALHVVEYGPAGDVAGETVLMLDGKTGKVTNEVESADDLLLVTEFADATGDGKAEVFLLTSQGEGDEPMATPPGGGEEYEWVPPTYGVAKADLTYIWSAEGDDDLYFEFMDGPFMSAAVDRPDFNGDAVPDFMRYSGYGFHRFHFFDEGDEEPRIEAISGATGELLWSVEEEVAMFEFAPVGDVDGDGGDDLARVRWDVPDGGEADEFNHYPGHLDLLRGPDAALFWSKLIFHPDAFPNATGDWIGVRATNGGDVDGNGIADVLLSMNAAGHHDCCVIIVSSDGCCEERALGLAAPGDSPEDEDDEEEKGEPFRLALVVEGATAETLMAYPEVPFPQEDAVEAGPAALNLEPEPEPARQHGILPGFGLLAAGLAFVALVAARRLRGGA